MKLNAVIAVEKGIKSKTKSVVDESYKLVQKADLFNGFNRQYQKNKDDGEDLPPEQKRVQKTVRDILKDVQGSLTNLVNIEATKDYANCKAVADVTVDGQVILTQAPVTYLLSVEKMLTDIHTFVEKLPLLDPADDWTLDTGNQLYKTAPQKTTRSKKIQKALVLLQPTEFHPGQAVQINEDETVGTWTHTKVSGAIFPSEQRALLAKIVKLSTAVKIARETANDIDVTEQDVGNTLLGYIFGN